MEASFVGIVPPAVGQLTIVHIVLAATIASDNAENNEQYYNDCQGQHHADKPAGVRKTLVAHHYRSLDAVRIDLMGRTLCIIMTIDRDNTNLVNCIWIQTGNFLIVLALLWLQSVPFRFSLNSV